MNGNLPPDRQLLTRTEGEGETLEMPEGFESFTSGQVLGERYQILEMLGRGGMGEVWHAFDLKLRVEVALKALREDLFRSERRLELLRQEVRAAREVVSPNVCRIFDLIEVEDRELVSMEYVDGATLLGVLQERGPLELKEAQDIASQFLAGLEAIHKVGLIHRDIKPENIMLTRAGRVVVMDFGLARQDTEGGGSVSGTPAYMAPEQAAGQTVDARADVYAAGVVLAEMVSPDGIKSHESRQSLWEGVRSEPAKLPDSPWAPAIKKAVAKDREQRYHTAHTLTRALEDVTLRVEGAEDLHPYPGLASFTEEDAEYFFGREAEVEQMWRKLDRPHLLAVVGPSGAGKTSFLQAGLAPSAGPGWGILRITPGNAPFTSLGQALAREMAGDVKAVELLARGHEPDALVGVVARWRKRHDHTLLIIDQFEELFTHDSADEQPDFSELLARLPLDADVFVLLSMRDDFLIRCREYEPLGPVFTDLTALLAPTGAALRRAMVQPATKCGYRFEEDDLVEEMLAEVEGERGALPLLAFALARLWEKRDRETGLITRQAYHDIGGVGGALARHAEATIDRIGTDRITIVRELFRNLVTAEGTRAVREWNELLSIFSDSHSESPAAVLSALIDARLLTSYEVREEEHEPTRRVEIIHESLLANWPRLVRWQTQDQDGAQLRDELRQASLTWHEHDRSDDRLWTGTAFREYQLWRERYPGGLTEGEEAFVAAMVSFATRRRRRRRAIATAGVAVLLAVLALMTTLWRRSVLQTRRAEAQKLVALGQLDLERFPTATLAWARASLGVADTREGRILALKALANGPIGRALAFNIKTEGPAHNAFFSPDGEWVAFVGYEKLKVHHRSRGPTVVVDTFPSSGLRTILPFFDETGSRLGVWRYVRERRAAEIRTYDVPGFTEIRRIEEPLGDGFRNWWFTHRGFFKLNRVDEQITVWHCAIGKNWEFFEQIENFSDYYFDPSGRWMVCRRGNELYLHSLEKAGVPPKRIGSLVTEARRFRVDPHLEWIATGEPGTTSVSVWPLGTDPGKPLRELDTKDLTLNTWSRFWIDRQGRHIAVVGKDDEPRKALVWDLDSPAGAEPLVLRDAEAQYINGINFDPTGRWVVTGNVARAIFWPIPETNAMVISNPGGLELPGQLAFTPDGSAIAIASAGLGVRLLPLTAGEAEHLLRYESIGGGLIVLDPDGRFAVVRGGDSSLLVLPMDGSEPRQLKGFNQSALIAAAAYDSTSGLVAGAAARGPRDQKVIRVWDLNDDSVRVLGPTTDAGDGFDGGYRGLRFLPDGRLLSAAKDGVRRWNLEDGSSEVLLSDPSCKLDVSPDGRTAAVVPFTNELCFGPVVLIDLATTEARTLPEYGRSNVSCAFGPQSGLFGASSHEGTIRVGRLGGGEPHLLFRRPSVSSTLKFSPDGYWIASGDPGDELIWLLPVPDVSKPAPQTLPHDELLAKLDTFTNFRVVRDETSSSGWKLEIGPFPGWAEVPEW